MFERCRKLKGFVHKWKIGKQEKHVHKEIWEEDYELIENEGLFQEYLEMGLFCLGCFVSRSAHTYSGTRV